MQTQVGFESATAPLSPRPSVPPVLFSSEMVEIFSLQSLFSTRPRSTPPTRSHTYKTFPPRRWKAGNKLECLSIKTFFAGKTFNLNCSRLQWSTLRCTPLKYKTWLKRVSRGERASLFRRQNRRRAGKKKV